MNSTKAIIAVCVVAFIGIQLYEAEVLRQIGEGSASLGRLVTIPIILLAGLAGYKFVGNKKGKEQTGDKSEWIKLGLIVLGMVTIPSALVLTGLDILYGLVGIPVWIIFIWFGIPKILKQK